MTEPSAAEFSRFVQEAREQRERADQAQARAAKFEALATDQQRLNEAMVASLVRGLEKLQASEAECARLREALQLEINEVRADVQRLTYGMARDVAASYWHSPKLERLYAALAATDRVRSPADQARREGADDEPADVD